jgi:hypothetical protein
MNISNNNHSLNIDRTFQSKLKELSKVTTNSTLKSYIETFEQIDFEIAHSQYSLDNINTLSEKKSNKSHSAEHFNDFLESRNENIEKFITEFNNLLKSNALSPENDFGITKYVTEMFQERISQYQNWQKNTNTSILEHTPKDPEILKLKLLDRIAVKLFAPEEYKKMKMKK